ncbi:MAG: metallophosphoesterase [Bacillota bacterium]
MELGFLQLAWIIGAAAVLGSVYSSVVERHWIDIRKVRILLKRLPRTFSGLRIALFSDVHLGFFYGPRHLSAAAGIISRQAPDVICLTGDFIESNSSLAVLEPVIPALSALNAPFGKYAVLGNHDYRAGSGHVAQCLETGGFRVLKNEYTVLRKETDSLYLIGLDDVLRGSPDPEKATRGIPGNSCKILLVHEPDCAGLIKAPVDLQLSGHSHGGQIRLPLIGAPYTTRLGKKHISGLYRAGKYTVYTNRGLGTTILPVRFLCRPEITIITLTTPDT